MLQPLRRRTWAPKGHTPVQFSWDRRDRLSVVSALTVSPQRRRLGLYFQIHWHNIHFAEFVALPLLVHRHLGRKCILVLDRYSVHRKAVRVLQQRGAEWFEVERLPPYAPDLNPTEQVWNHSKYADLANFIPEDADHLYAELVESLEGQKHEFNLLRSHFHYAKLRL